jgi:hypothetical protein
VAKIQVGVGFAEGIGMAIKSRQHEQAPGDAASSGTNTVAILTEVMKPDQDLGI